MDERERQHLRAVAYAAAELFEVPRVADTQQWAPLQAAVDALQASLDALRTFDREADASKWRAANDPVWALEPWFDGWIRPKLRPCEQCGALIFFAVQPTAHWLPLEPDPVSAREVVASWRYVVTFSDPPKVDTMPSVHDGPVWVDHRQTCGIRPEGPRFKVLPYTKRWVINQARAETVADALVGSLDRLRRSLSVEPEARQDDR